MSPHLDNYRTGRQCGSTYAADVPHQALSDANHLLGEVLLRVSVTFPSGEYKGVTALDADVCRSEIYPSRVLALLVPQVYLRLRVGHRILDPKASKDGGSSWRPRKG